MSTFRIDLTKIEEIHDHPNADRLSIVKVFDWSVVTQKGRYKLGDKVIYIPVDSILTQELEDRVFPVGSKIKLTRHRVKSIKIRQHISQGMILDPEEYDYSYVQANVSKYEPPTSSIPRHMHLMKKKTKPDLKAFVKYSDIENYKYYNRLFQDGEQVYVSEKLHGTSARYGWFRTEANTVWQKILNFFGLLPQWTFAWGSRNVQIQVKLFKRHQGFFSESQGVAFDDVYSKMITQYDLKNIIPKGWAIYGEIVGDGIQKNYTYGCGPNEHKLYVYDIRIDDQYLSYDMFAEAIDFLGLDAVPQIYVGPFDAPVVETFKTGDSTIGGQKIREGVVLKSVIEGETTSLSRKVLKMINDEYYLRDQTDFH